MGTTLKDIEEDLLMIMIGLARSAEPFGFRDILEAAPFTRAALSRLLRTLQDQNLIDYNIFRGYTVSEYYQDERNSQ